MRKCEKLQAVLVLAVCLAFASCGGFAKAAQDDDDGAKYPPSVVFAWLEKSDGSPRLHVRFNEDVKAKGAQGWSFEGASALSFTGAAQGAGSAELIFPLSGAFSHTDNAFAINYLRAFGSVESANTGQPLSDIYGLKPANSAINPSNPSGYTILKFDSKDGEPTIDSTLTVALGTSVGLPVDLRKAEAVFGGWSETDGGSEAVANPYTPTLGGGQTQTLFAIWKAGVEDAPSPADALYDVIADGIKNTETTTALYLSFGKPVNLTAGNITITSGTANLNSAISLAGSGVQWKVGVSGVSAEGYISFSVKADGIESAAKRVAIHKYNQGGAVPTNPPKPYQYKVTADGDTGTPTTNLRFIFESAVSIEAAEVAIENSAVLSKEYLTASNAGNYSAVWDLAASAAQTGETRVKIGNSAIVDEWKTVMVYAGSGGGSTGGGSGQDYIIFADGANGTATTTKLYLLFKNPVQGLTHNNINIVNDSGTANKNSTLTQSGNLYELPVSVSKAGAVHVSISNVTGVYSGLKAVIVHFSGQNYPNVPGAPTPPSWPPSGGAAVDYTVSADSPTTHLIFGFDRNIYGAGLTASNITITDDTGHAVKTGVFRGAGSLYILDVSDIKTGWVKVAVSYSSIVPTEKRVYVEAGLLTDYTAAPVHYNRTTASIDFVFSKALSDTLKLSEIQFVTGGIAGAGVLTGSGTKYNLTVTVQNAGDLYLNIVKAGVVDGQKKVTIQKASNPGITWTEGRHFDDGSVYELIYANGKFVMGTGGSATHKIEYSTDGVTWYAANAPMYGVTEHIDSLVYDGSKFIVGGTGSSNGAYYTIIAQSTDGVNWTEISDNTFSGNYRLTDMVYGNGKFVAVGGSGKIAYSSDGINWHAVADSKFGTTNIAVVAYGNSKFVAVGYDSKMAYSTDGINWTKQNLDMGAITYGDGKFVAEAGEGNIVYSTDGVNWTVANDSIFRSAYVHRVNYCKDKFVAVGGGGKIAYSYDGIEWTETLESLAGLYAFKCLTYGNNKIVAGGYYSSAAEVPSPYRGRVVVYYSLDQ